MIEAIKKTLWAAADKLRANTDAAEYKHLVLGLIFVKYISDTFAARRAELSRRFADPKDDYYLEDARLLAEELEDRDYYKEVNVFWVPESARLRITADSRYELSVNGEWLGHGPARSWSIVAADAS